MTYIAAHERARKKRETPEFILATARRKGSFEASWRHRDDWLRRRCADLVKKGLLKVSRRQSGHGFIVYLPVKEQSNA